MKLAKLRRELKYRQQQLCDCILLGSSESFFVFLVRECRSLSELIATYQKIDCLQFSLEMLECGF